MTNTTERQSRPRVLICGGRDYHATAEFELAMERFIAKHGMPRTIIHGAARGADTLAHEWALWKGVQLIEVPANWKEHGLRAGPVRNQLMLDLLEPDFVVSFPGGAGTADMVRRAKAAGVFIYEV